MSKIVIEDIKKDRRSLRDVLPSRGEARVQHGYIRHHKESEEVPAKTSKKRYYEECDDSDRSGFSWVWGTLIIIGVVVFLGYFVAPIFTQVTIEVTPKNLTIDISEPIKASRDNVSDRLTFTVLPVAEKKVAVSVPATGDKQVESKASGKIRITNSFSADPQPLVASTRFTSKSGKVYRIAQSITVPGVKGSNPGTIDVNVYADKPGAAFNESLTDFTIPGFAGSPKFEKITARSVTPMTGGMVGTIKSVSSSTEAVVRNQINEQLKKDLYAVVLSQVPDGFFTTESLINFTSDINQVPQQGQATSTASFVGTGSATALMFNELNFTSYVVEAVISPESAKKPIKISNLDSLKINVLPNFENADWSKIESIDLAISGKANFVWQVDPKKLANDLAGKPKEAFASVFDGYGESIEGGKVVFRPSWSNKFPDDPSQIKIELLTAN